MLRSEVVAAVQADAGLSKAVRQEALALVETFPENAHLLNETSWLIVSRPGAEAARYQRALHLARAACRAAPDIANYVNTLGVAYYRAGRYTEAVAELRKSLPEDTTNGIDSCDLYFLAMCHYRLGDAAKARECLELAKDSHQRNATRMQNPQQFERFRTEAEELLAKPAKSRERPRDTAP
jgi:tetratricopeptide (TPR) repeat protein